MQQAFRIVALVLIWGATTLAWIVLDVVLVQRTDQADAVQRGALGSLWGPQQAQRAPDVSCGRGKTFSLLPLTDSKLAVDLALDQRRKGLLWYNTYRVAFDGSYRFSNTGAARNCTFALAFPSEDGIYDDVRVLVNGKPVENAASFGAVSASIPMDHAATATVEVSYASRGLGQWEYVFGSGVSTVRNFVMRMRTDFGAIDFPSGTMSPTSEQRTANGWDLTWDYRDLITGNGIGMVMPELLQPGPLAQRITTWAPLSLLFYFFVMFIITTIRRIDLHPMNYFFLAAAFFAFQLLFAYTVD
ncbi:MAG: hypothetical protein JOY86_03745, partial [Candidatus Eremiobacteraeota bacterium]|nr:hypothetical protein [Candidatus Eremiobacteraeota bacterium]